MSWTATYVFVDPMLDLRSEPDRARILGADLARELGPGHELHGPQWAVIAEATPQDEVLVEAGDAVHLVHLTWTGRREQLPWPLAERVNSAEDFERLMEVRY